MKAIVYTKRGDLEKRDIPTPRPGKGQVLVKVQALALNIADYQRFQIKNGRRPWSVRLTDALMGYVNAPIGSEVSGVVVETGAGVNHVRRGDAVFGETSGRAPKGGCAEYALLDAYDTATIPECWSFEQAAAVCTSFKTAYGAIRKADISTGSDVLVYGASGGVGLYAVQLAKASGARVTGVCSTRNVEMALKAGCSLAIDYRTEDFTACGRRFDAILGINGCNPMSSYRKLLKPNGVFVGVGNANQAAAALGASIISRHFTYYAGAFTREPQWQAQAKKLAVSGALQPFIDRTYPVSQIRQAVDYLSAGHARGKVVVTMG